MLRMPLIGGGSRWVMRVLHHSPANSSFFARAKYHQSLTVFGILLQPEAMDKTGDRASRGLTALPKPPS